MSTAKRDPNQSKSGKAPTFQIRITPELKAQFEAAAKEEGMSRIVSKVDPRGAEFAANAQWMRGLVADLEEKVARVQQGGGEEARRRHTARGKLLPRERIDHLLDPGTPFLEIGQMAAFGMYGDEAPSAGMIAGVGRVEGVECLSVANDATVKGGTY